MDQELQKLIELLATHQDPKARRDASYYGDLNAQAINKMNPLQDRYRAAYTLANQAGMMKPYENLEAQLLHAKQQAQQMRQQSRQGVRVSGEQEYQARRNMIESLMQQIRMREEARRLGTIDENRPRALAQRGASGRSF
jgi:hypothetical protein